jgi:flagella basal body P-ring formation protein FlgA
MRKAIIYRRTALASASVLFLLTAAVASAATWDPETELRSYLKAHYPWAEVELGEIRLSATPPAEPPAAVVVEKTPPGRSAFRFEFRNGESVSATALVKAFDRVFMSREAFRRDHVMRQDDIYPTLMDSARIPKGALREASEIVGNPLLRSIVANAPVTDAMVSRTPIVKRGRKVVLSVETSGFSVRLPGETKTDAAVGERIKVLNTTSGKIVTGLLTDERTVRVEY